jgi:hypothetical protein
MVTGNRFPPISKRPAPGRPKEMVSACGGQQMIDVKNMTERESYIIA